MQYMGGKMRQAPVIRDFVSAHKGARTNYVEPFVGGGSVFSAVASLFETATAGDAVPELVMLWQDVYKGWVPPEHITEEHWRALRHDAPSALKGWAAYAGSFKGKYFAGYAGRAERKYIAEAQRAIVKKVAAMPENATFVCSDYARHAVDSNTVVYCDPPYAGTESYSGAGEFDHGRFWATAEGWVASGALVLVHEYTAPEGWTPVLTTDRVETMHTGRSSGVRKEILFMKCLTEGDESTMDAEDFFAAPVYADREPSRPRAVNPATGKEQSWTRASNYAAELDSPFGLLKRNQRKLIEGLSQRPDLARLLLVGSVIDDKTKQDEIIAAAMAVAEADSAANNGTAAHTALVRSWLGEPVPEEFHPLVKSFVRALKDNGLKPKAAEQRVLNLAFDSLGHFDWVFEEADGAEVIGDVKTGRLDVAKRKFSVQLAMYDGADFVLHKDGRVEPTPWKLSHTHAVLVHVDLEHNAVSIYRVDLHIGRHGAALAEQVRRWHKMDPLTPYVPPLAGSKPNVDDLGRHVQKTASGHLISLPAPSAGLAGTRPDNASPHTVGGPLEAVDFDAPDVASAFDDHPGVTVNKHGQDGVTVNEHPEVGGAGVPFEPQTPPAHPIDQQPAKPYDIDARFAELMTLEKAQLQSILKNKHNWRDDAHNRRWLARAIIVLEQGWTDAKQIVKYAAAKDDSEPAQPMTVPEAAQAVAEVDRTVARRSIALEAIAGAQSVAALAAFHKDWTGRYGEAAWTDELAALAKARTADLDVLAESAVRARIDGATKPEHLANLWNDVTIGGSAPSKWEPFNEQAKARLQQLREQQPPVAANPFGG